jgi:hypothetical protein
LILDTGVVKVRKYRGSFSNAVKENCTANAQIDVGGEKRVNHTLEDRRFFLERLKLTDTYSEKRPLL